MKKSQRGFYLTILGVLCWFMLTARDNVNELLEKDVIVVFKTHFDIGYTDWADNVRYNYAGPMVEGALDIIEQSKQMPAHQQFNWIIAGCPMKEMLENSKPEVKPRIEQAIRNGNFTVHGLPFTFETEACEPESMVRSLGYSSAINRQAGLPLPIDAKQTDVPAISLDRPGLWKYSTDFIPQKGNVFFNLYNNQWSTNFTEWIEGSWQARFYLWSFDSYSNEQSVITPSEEFLNPLMAAYATGKPGNMPLSAAGLTLSRKGLQIGAFCPNPDGDGTLLRIWEQAGNGSEVTITLPPRIGL